MAENIRGFLETLLEFFFFLCFLNIIMYVNFFIDLKFEFTASTTLKYCYKYALNKKLKLMREAMTYFVKKLLSHEIFRSMVSWTNKMLFEKFVKLSPPPPPPPNPLLTYLIYASLIIYI